MCPIPEIRQLQKDEAALIRNIVAHHLGLPLSQVTNWTRLSLKAKDIVADASRALNKQLPPTFTLADDTDVVALIAAYRDVPSA